MLIPALITMTPVRAVRFIALWSAFLIVGAYTLEYGFGIKPCALCWLQRYVHWALLALGVLVMVQPKIDPRRGLKLLVEVAVFGVGLAIYHSLVEAHILIAGCSKPVGQLAVTAADMLTVLADSPVPACDKPHHILWLSLPQWNVLAQGLIVVFGVFNLRHPDGRLRVVRTVHK